jgi:glycosyltransferase involved in cell wall biosynthesis
VDSAAVRADAEANPRDDLAGEGALVGTVARLEPVKAVRDFLRMAALVVGHRPGTRFVVAGTGPQDAELRELASSLGLADAVTFLGSVPSAAGVLDACDVVVLTSRSEGLPTVPLEAMALGKPMVATAVGGTPEVVRDEETGLLAPSGNVVALTEAVERLLADPKAAAALGAMGRQVVEREFSVSLMKRAHLAAYRSLLNA